MQHTKCILYFTGGNRVEVLGNPEQIQGMLKAAFEGSNGMDGWAKFCLLNGYDFFVKPIEICGIEQTSASNN